MELGKKAQDQILKAKVDFSKNAAEPFYSLFDKTLQGKGRQKVYLIPGEPGSGKSRGIQDYLMEYARGDREAPDAGTVVFTTTKEEIRSLIHGSGLNHDDYAVLISGDKKKILSYYGGCRVVDEAPILFTTKQMLYRRCQGDFADCADFFYKGEARKLRLWDEDFFAADVAIINIDRLSACKELVRPAHAALADEISQIEAEVAKRPLPPTMMVPASIRPHILVAASGGALNAAQESLLYALAEIAGTEVRLALGASRAPCLVGARNRLPMDLAPLYVFDASARVSTTYAIMEREGVPIERLPAKPLCYGNATFYHMRLGAGRTTLAKQPNRIRVLHEAAAVINGKPAEKWLVLYGRVNGADIEAELQGLLDSSVEAEFVYWGNHRAKNDFRHIRNVMCIGLPRYSQPGYEELHIRSAGNIAHRASDLSELAKSEITSSMLQGFARSNMRQHAGDWCGICTIYIMDKEPELPGWLRVTFPSCSVKAWLPTVTKLSVQKAKVLDALLSIKSTRSVPSVSKKQVYDSLGIDRANFRRTIGGTDFARALAENAITATSSAFLFT